MKSSAKILLLLICSAPLGLVAEIYKCDLNGRIVFQDNPCPDGAQQAKVRNTKTEETQESQSIKQPPNLLRAYEYIGQPVKSVAELFDETLNSANNFTASNGMYEVFFQSDVGQVSFVDIRFKDTTPCSQQRYYDSVDYMRLLGLDVTLLVKRSGGAYYADSFSDVEHRLKVTFMCPYNGGEYSASFSQKYY
ncbi:DUF4124 domain-containing protein [Shewanella sp. Isolate11]|uniref:DUF4124 domain-containing protein n=1 Tax=Shewanella sp. Isolate11 TaxID=2908530 RepID=UPI001EFE2B10|nr:DUF4124 domain-containing protein [Shewanella sp. Isolate11]MCG9697452.1 DUF4124 domain-containing protein [Shewanella sp. Isolate11]